MRASCSLRLSSPTTLNGSGSPLTRGLPLPVRSACRVLTLLAAYSSRTLGTLFRHQRSWGSPLQSFTHQREPHLFRDLAALLPLACWTPKHPTRASTELCSPAGAALAASVVTPNGSRSSLGVHISEALFHRTPAAPFGAAPLRHFMRHTRRHGHCAGGFLWRGSV